MGPEMALFEHVYSPLPSILALLGISSLACYTCLHEPFNMKVDERELFFEGLAAELDGLEILFISDLHIRRWDYRVLWVHDQLCKREAPLILLGGDMVEESGREVLREFLPVLKAPMGVYMVAGNNENEQEDREKLFEEFEDHGVVVLRNQALRVKDSLTILGVDDPSEEQDDLFAACEDWDRESFAILLSHTPEVFPEAGRYAIPLTLAGHTHGGQVRLPLLGALYTDTPRTGLRYVSGHYRQGSSQMLLSRGIGMSKLPLRCLCSPQIHCLTLRAC